MRKVVVLSGLSGSGKSHLAQKLVMDHMSGELIKRVIPVNEIRPASVVVVSADDYFMKDGIYQFNPAEIAQAHNHCFLEYMTALLEEVELVIVDNTNTTEVEIAPYMLAASAYDYEAEIITLRCSMAMASERNVHNVPTRGIEAQWVALNSRKLAPWWKNTDIVIPDPYDTKVA